MSESEHTKTPRDAARQQRPVEPTPQASGQQAAPLFGPEFLLALQRTVGNQEVNNLLRRYHAAQTAPVRPPLADPPDAGRMVLQRATVIAPDGVGHEEDENAFTTDAAGAQHDAAGNVVTFRAPDGVYVEQATASGGQSQSPSGGDPNAPSQASGPSAPDLDQQYNAAVQAGNWQDAAEKLNGFNHEDILSRLAQLTPDQITNLHQGALDNPRVGSESQVAQLTAPGTPPASMAPPPDPTTGPNTQRYTVVSQAPPVVMITGPLNDATIGQDLYGDASAPIEHLSDFSQIKVRVDALQPAYQALFAAPTNSTDPNSLAAAAGPTGNVPLSFAGVVLASPLVSAELLGETIPAATLALPATGGGGFVAGAFQAGSFVAPAAGTAGATETTIAVTGGVIGAVEVTEAATAITILGLSLTPVGWLILAGAVVVVAAGAVGTYYAFHTDHQVRPSTDNNPVQLPPAQNTPPATDPNTPGPLYTPADQNYTPAIDPTTGQPLQLPGQPNAGSMQAASLEDEYNAAVQGGNWQDAAEKLNGFNRDDILSRLSRLTPDQVANIYQGALTNPRVGPGSQAAQLSDPTHRQDLGNDPAIGRFRPGERDSALRVEQARGVRLSRYTPPSPGLKGDWVDTTGKVYDGCSPAPSSYFEAQINNYEASLRSHLNNPNVDYVVIDITGLALLPNQLQALEVAITKVAGANNPKIIRLP